MNLVVKHGNEILADNWGTWQLMRNYVVNSLSSKKILQVTGVKKKNNQCGACKNVNNCDWKKM